MHTTVSSWVGRTDGHAAVKVMYNFVLVGMHMHTYVFPKNNIIREVCSRTRVIPLDIY